MSAAGSGPRMRRDGSHASLTRASAVPDADDRGASGDGGAPDFPAVLRGSRRWLFARLVLNGTLQGGTALLLPFAILGLSGAGEAGLPGAGFPSSWFWAAILPIAALALAVAGLRVIELTDAERLGLDYVAEMRLRLFDGLAQGHARSSHGVAMARMMNDLSALRNWVGLGLARSVTAGLALSGCIVAAIALSPHHAGAIALPLGLVALVAGLVAGPLRHRVAEARRLRGRLARRLGEILPGLGIDTDRAAVAKARERVARASTALVGAQVAQIRLAATLRSLPDLLMPGAVLAAVMLGLPLGMDGGGAESVGMVLLAGLAAGPLRQLLRALEYRAAFVVARRQLASGIAPGPEAQEVGGDGARPQRPARAGARPSERTGRRARKARATADADSGGAVGRRAAAASSSTGAGLVETIGTSAAGGDLPHWHEGTPVDAAADLGATAGPSVGAAGAAGPAAAPPRPGACPVTSRATVLAGTLRRNIDIARRHRGKDETLAEIADLCGLLAPGIAPSGIGTRLDPADPRLTGAWRTRLALARAIAAGSREIVLHAPDLLASDDGRALLDRLAARFGLRFTTPGPVAH